MRGSEERVDRSYPAATFRPDPRDDYSVAEPVSLALQVRKDGDKCHVSGRVCTTLSLSCSRCLEQFRDTLRPGGRPALSAAQRESRGRRKRDRGGRSVDGLLPQWSDRPHADGSRAVPARAADEAVVSRRLSRVVPGLRVEPERAALPVRHAVARSTPGGARDPAFGAPAALGVCAVERRGLLQGGWAPSGAVRRRLAGWGRFPDRRLAAGAPAPAVGVAAQASFQRTRRDGEPQATSFQGAHCQAAGARCTCADASGRMPPVPRADASAPHLPALRLLPRAPGQGGRGRIAPPGSRAGPLAGCTSP